MGTGPIERLISGVIDTGCTGIEISEAAISRLGVFPFDKQQVATAGGRVQKWFYNVEIKILGADDSALLELPNVVIRTLPPLSSLVEALVGWSILSSAILRMNGPRREFRLSF